MDVAFDKRLRDQAFAFLRALQLRTGGPARFEDVAAFEFEGERVALMDRQRGIRKPRVLDAALSFRTVHAENPEARPYADVRGADGYLRYKWRGTDAGHAENVALRRAAQQRLGLIWFCGIASGIYLPIYPVWLVDEEPDEHQFVVALDADEAMNWSAVLPGDELRRRYADRVARERLHQPLFRERVLHAYARRCSICNLRHVELLDAAHIIADGDAGGDPVVPNGLALCKLHHAAFDSQLLGIDPKFKVHIRPDLLAESDGPTLEHGLQGMHGSTLFLPHAQAARPDPARLEVRFKRFATGI